MSTLPAKKPKPPMKPMPKDKKAKNKSKTKAKGFKPPKPMNPTAVPPMLGF
jgi:hypothetical protein